MKKPTKTSGIKIKSHVRAGGVGNHNRVRAGVKVRTTVRAGGFGNHNRVRAA